MRQRMEHDPISQVGPNALTERQREVARLIAAGLTNAEIAEHLAISLDGAKYHVSSVLTRLGLRRREEAAEWYRAHFGPTVRLRRWLRGLFALPTLGVVGGGAAVVGLVAVGVFAIMTLQDDGVVQAVGPREYPPFQQEWEVYRDGQGVEFATLDWNSCEDWVYERRDASGNVLNTTQSDGPDGDGACHIPGVWFRPLRAWLGPGKGELGPYTYEHAYTRPCSDTEGANTVSPRLPDDFCSDPSGRFEDRTVAEFDPETTIPMLYQQYLDGSLIFEHRAVSLLLKSQGATSR